MIDNNFLQQTLIDLVRINSINPSLTLNAPGEVAIAHYTADLLRHLGLETTIYEVEPGRLNVVGRLKGQGNGKSLLWNAHMDTVGVEGMTEPFSGAIRDGKLYGRGAVDMKGSLAAMLAAAKGLLDANIKLAGDLVITAVADEEYTSIGTVDLLNHIHTDAAIVTEPTNMTIGRAHRGFIWYDVETHGRAAHGSHYHEGIDANMRMGRFLAELDKHEQALRQRPPHPLVGTPSLHAALLQGGTEISMYAAHCRLKIERRTIPGETVDSVTPELQTILNQLQAADTTFKASLQTIFYRNPFEVSAAADIVQKLAVAIHKRLGQPATHTGQSFWTDAALFAEAGIETLLIGPIGHGLHSAEEWVDLQSVLDLAHILAETAILYCRE